MLCNLQLLSLASRSFSQADNLAKFMDNEIFSLSLSYFNCLTSKYPQRAVRNVCFSPLQIYKLG